MKEIQLTQSEVAIVDDEDHERISVYNWHVNKCQDGTCYARHDFRLGKERKHFLMHREVLRAKKSEIVDHINGNGLDNRKENLRFCTHSENMCNRIIPHKNNKLGIKGVSLIKTHKKFKAQIRINGKVIYLGLFTVLADADQAYRVAELKYFGDFAREETKKLYQAL